MKIEYGIQRKVDGRWIDYPVRTILVSAKEALDVLANMRTISGEYRAVRQIRATEEVTPLDVADEEDEDAAY